MQKINAYRRGCQPQFLIHGFHCDERSLQNRTFILKMKERMGVLRY